MVYETTHLQMPAAEDALHSKSKNVPHRIDRYCRDWKWYYVLERVYMLANLVTCRM